MGTVADKLAKLLETKAALRTAIQEKGVEVTDTDPFSSYPDKVRTINAGPTLNHAQVIEALARSQIKAGDTVYTMAGNIAPIIKADFDGSRLSRDVNAAAFSPNGTVLVLGGDFAGIAKVYSVVGDRIDYAGDIYADGNETPLPSYARAVTFSPDGKLLVLGGAFGAKIYSVDGTAITYISDIYAGGDTSRLLGLVYAAAFSPDGKMLVLGGSFSFPSSSECAQVYSIDETSVTYVGHVPGANTLVHAAAFSPDGKLLVVGGDFPGKAKVYSVDGFTITYAGDIFADAGSTALNNKVWGVAISPDGKSLVATGGFSAYAKFYSINGVDVTYIGDISVPAGTRMVYCAAFTPDGKMLILGGGPVSSANVYLVGEAVPTHLCEIYADEDGTVWTRNYVNGMAVSPDGKTLVLGGTISNWGISYAVEDGGVRYKPSDTTEVYLAPLGEIRTDLAPVGVGWALEDIALSDVGRVTVIGNVK